MAERVNISSEWSWLPYISLGFLVLTMVFDQVTSKEVILILILALCRNWRLVYLILNSYDLSPISSIFIIVASVPIAFVATQATKWLRTLSATNEVLANESPKPVFFPSRTTHTRFFPKTHSFSYSYLLVGIPVGWQGSRAGMLSADLGNHNVRNGLKDDSSKSTWYTVDAGDYLDRGYRHLGLNGKLKKYMESQGLRHEDYPYAYFITAPKFLGYSFNPVSFWYLYSADRQLTAMILEVNNTFDERHPYFLKAAEVSSGGSDEPRIKDPKSQAFPTEKWRNDLHLKTGLSIKSMMFTSSWAKEFHVSPFNSRKGTYSLVAYDPLYPSMTGQGHINNTITLMSSKEHPKLVARIFSEGDPIDPQKMSAGHKLKFLLAWWWVGLITYPRIVREAGKLFFRRKLHVWFRPEPLKASISRHANATEQVLEASFRSYLCYLVESAASPLIVKYVAAGIVDALGETMVSRSTRENESHSRILEIRVLTPLFYSRFVHYAHDLEAFHSEFSESGTIWLSQPSVLPALVLKRLEPLYSISSPVNYVAFKVIQALRRPPSPTALPSSSRHAVGHDRVVSKIDIRISRMSAMDGYFLTKGTLSEQRKYRTEMLKLFISDYIAMGNSDLFRAELLLLKILLAWALAGGFFT